MLRIYAVFLLVMGIAAFVMYGIDKRRAKKKQWRIPERTLLLSGFFGGGTGALLGMAYFRHKTLHWYFHAVNWAGAVWQLALLFILAQKTIG